MSKIPLSILLIEDNVNDQELVLCYISQFDSFIPSVSTAISLAQSFELLSIMTFDLILLDLGLPDSQGIETILRIKNQINKEKTKILILTVTKMDEKTLEQNNIRGYINKENLSTETIEDQSKYALCLLSFRDSRNKINIAKCRLENFVNNYEEKTKQATSELKEENLAHHQTK